MTEAATARTTEFWQRRRFKLGNYVRRATAITLVLAAAASSFSMPIFAATRGLTEGEEKSLLLEVKRDGLDRVLAELTRDVSGRMLCERRAELSQRARYQARFARRVAVLLTKHNDARVASDPIIITSCEHLTRRSLLAMEEKFSFQLAALESTFK